MCIYKYIVLIQYTSTIIGGIKVRFQIKQWTSPHKDTMSDILALCFMSSFSSQLIISSSMFPLLRKLKAYLVPQFL